MKRLVALMICTVSLVATAQNPNFDPDFDGDGCFTVEDFVTILTLYGSCDDSTEAPLLGYFFHGGNQSYPFVQSSSGLTDPSPITLYYDDGQGNIFTPTTNLSVAMSYIMDNLGSSYAPGDYTVETFDIPPNGVAEGLGSSDALNFDASEAGEFYYIILPDGEVDLTSVNPLHLVDGGIETRAIEKAPFTWNGDAYWLYRLGGGSQTFARTITFSDND